MMQSHRNLHTFYTTYTFTDLLKQYVHTQTIKQGHFYERSLQIIRLGVSDYNLHLVPYNNVTTLFPKPIRPLPNTSNTPIFPARGVGLRYNDSFCPCHYRHKYKAS